MWCTSSKLKLRRSKRQLSATAAQMVSQNPEQLKLEAEVDRLSSRAASVGGADAYDSQGVPAEQLQHRRVRHRFHALVPKPQQTPGRRVRNALALRPGRQQHVPTWHSGRRGLSRLAFQTSSSPFTEQVATATACQYNRGNRGARWRETIKLYLICNASEIEIIGKSVKIHEDVHATFADPRIQNLGLSDDQVESLACDL